MSEQEEKVQGGIPPKVSPLATAPAAPVAGAPRPITVRLKPVAAAAEPDSVAPTLAQPNPRATSRVPVPEEVAKATVAPVRPVTVRLRPLATPGGVAAGAPPPAPGSTKPITKVDAPASGAVTPMRPQHPPTPGANPLPAGPKPLSPAQQHAAKSKTSRISLDSAIGVAPVGEDKGGPKTIRLKRPSDLAAPVAVPGPKSATTVVRQTSRIPDAALSAADAATAATATVTQKKTLKIKRPGLKEPDAGDVSEGGDAFPEGVQMTPINPSDFASYQEPSPALTAVAAIAAIAATVAIFATMWFLAAHAIGSVAGKNSTAFVEGPDLPCPGRMIN